MSIPHISLPLSVILLFSMPSLSRSQQAALPVSSSQLASMQQGGCVFLDQCPSSNRGVSYVTAGMIVPHSVDKVWSVVNDAEGAPRFIDGLESAKILQSSGTEALIEQKMKVKGMPGTFTYVVKQECVPGQQLEFKKHSGPAKAFNGGWWLYPVNGGAQTLLVYALHLNPGLMAPKSLVHNSLSQRIPETLRAVRKEVMRRG